jgi:hypothetical protein
MRARNTAAATAASALAIFAAWVCAIPSRAADRPDKVAQALRDRYGDVQTEIVGQSRIITGVRLYQVKVNGDRSARTQQRANASSSEYHSTAQVTEFGDFLASGTPIAFRKLPEPVQQVKELFRTTPIDADAFVADSYYFDLKRGGEDRLYRMRYDAVGRLRQIINPDEVDRTETTHFQTASNDQARKIEDLARRQAPRDAKIKNVYKDPRYEGFYVAKYVKADGKEFLVTLNDAGDIYSTRDEVDMRDIPQPIRDSFDKMFDANKVKWVYRTRDEYSQFQQKTESGDLVTFRVRPDGTIMDVRNEAVNPADEKAITASEHQTTEDRQRNTNNRDRGSERISH